MVVAAFQSILRHRLRSLLAMLGMIVGVGAVIVAVALGTGAQYTMGWQVRGLATNMFVIAPVTTRVGAAARGDSVESKLSVEDATALAQRAFRLSAVSPVVQTRVDATSSSSTWRTQMIGVGSRYPAIRNWGVAAGDFFDEGAVQMAREVVVLGATAAKNLFPDQAAVAKVLIIDDRRYQVIGVLEEKGSNVLGLDQDDMVLVPFTVLQGRASGLPLRPLLVASGRSLEELAAARDEIRSLLRELHELAPGAPDDFRVQNQNDLAETAQDVSVTMALVLLGISVVAAIVGGISIMNIMFASVTERTREIGLRVAVGARDSDIIAQILIESGVLSAVAGLLGAAVGVAGSLLVARISEWPIALPPIVIAAAPLAAALLGVMFSVLPAIRAATLTPLHALRD